MLHPLVSGINFVRRFISGLGHDGFIHINNGSLHNVDGNTYVLFPIMKVKIHVFIIYDCLNNLAFVHSYYI